MLNIEKNSCDYTNEVIILYEFLNNKQLSNVRKTININNFTRSMLFSEALNISNMCSMFPSKTMYIVSDS